MSVWKPTPHTQHHKLNLQVALLTVANGSSTVTILTQTTIQLAQAYCKTPTSAGFHSGATTVTSGVHCAKKNPTDTPNNYKGNQPMKTTKPEQHQCDTCKKLFKKYTDLALHIVAGCQSK